MRAQSIGIEMDRKIEILERDGQWLVIVSTGAGKTEWVFKAEAQAILWAAKQCFSFEVGEFTKH
jgi:late competence protein required for DNA uptake (superfamily II DNA/RNA helicase)